MLYGEKNDGGIELHLNVEERKLFFNALRYYSAYGENLHEKLIMEQMEDICCKLNVLHLPEFDRTEGV